MTRANASESLSLSRPTAVLGAWAAAWLAGTCSPDVVIDTLADIAPRHVLVTDDDAEDRGTGTADLLTLLHTARFVDVRLPAPGDPQGLPPGAREVLRAGEALVLTTADDPTPTVLYPGRRDGDLFRWQLTQFGDDIAPLTDYSVGTASRDLKEATRTAADVLTDLPSASSGTKDTLRTELAEATARRTITLPPHESPRVDKLLDAAARIDAILDVATSRNATFGLTARQGEGGDAQIRELRSITRRAVTVGVNALIVELLGAPD